MEKLRQQQLEAAQQLAEALSRCTEVGVLDQIQDYTKSPDSINDVCEALDGLLNGRA